MQISIRAGAPPREPQVTGAPACAREPQLFLHPTLEVTPSRSRVPRVEWAAYLERLERVRAACAACPAFADCLYTAVAQVDVAGFIGCTTPAERKQIRQLLGVSVAPEDLDAAAGVRGERRPVDHETVLAVRAAFPEEPLEELAARLECSLSTVKRHLRRARKVSGGRTADDPGNEAATQRAETSDGRRPTVAEVLDAFDRVVEAQRR